MTYQDELLHKFRGIEPRLTAALRRLLVGVGGRVELGEVVAQGPRLYVVAKIHHGRPHDDIVSVIALTRDTRFAGGTFVGRDWFNSGWLENHHPRYLGRKVYGAWVPLPRAELHDDHVPGSRLPIVAREIESGLAEAAATMDAIPADPRAAAEHRRVREAFRAAVEPLVGDWAFVGDIPGQILGAGWNRTLYLELPEAEDPALFVNFYDRDGPVSWNTARLDRHGRPTWLWFRWARVSPDNARVDFPDPSGRSAAWWSRPPAGK